MAGIIAIVGRPNVGKSTLFNRLTGRREAIVDNTPGVTRDRIYAAAEWLDKSFTVVDTGGYTEGSSDDFESEIRKQARYAIDEAHVIILVVDGREGLSPLDEEVADQIRKSGKPHVLAVNKIDSPADDYVIADFLKLGFNDVFPISAVNGHGTGDLLDKVVGHLPCEADKSLDFTEDLPKICVVGRPNVGKSSFLNALTGRDQHIVSDVAGTTRDAVHTRYNMFGFDFYLVDTAGLRKKGKVSEDLEFYSVMRAIKSIENSDVCILMIDATRGIEAQDLNIFHLIEKNKKGVVIAVNKWDLTDKTQTTASEFRKAILERIKPFTDVPILFTSSIEKTRLLKTLQEALEVYKRRKVRIPTSQLNETLLPIFENTPPPVYKGKTVSIKYITQLPTPRPQFAFFCNLPQYIKEPYKRFIENQLRSMYDFTGVPLDIYFRKK
ncbi:ribosome biogenesis GTPase Der [Schleiferia thermophila]|jgi:GTP-binding protein|uniref:GTPase Der n=1 Tax=Schleiferia thermophila TaxID=884107 RepID=A0A368ZZA7_9FLAO|nr:ribosome biogenesis GTPase Der [Schleiferia thermophila]RCX02291.1 GTP-binding protein [Schleiferia thermophila]GCD80823.1 GTPase Der [Schleiferia thermophila]